jgi:hypothetical protein
MSGKTIGLNMNNGFAGSYARQPNMVINTKPNIGATAIPFGAPVMQGTNGVQFPTASLTAANFVGIASRQIQSADSYLNQNGAGEYKQNDAVPVFQQGRINVKVADGTPAMYGDVYVRTVAATGKAIGDFECTSDTGNNVKLDNCQWGGPKDANGVAELVIFTGIGA